MGGVGGEVVTQQPSHTYTIFLHHPFPNQLCLFEPLARLCSNMKMESDKGRML